MELLQQILEGLWNGFWALVRLVEPLIAALVGAIFNVEVSPADARGFTVVLLVLLFAWLIGKVFLSFTKGSANKPMEVKHTTDKTPAQVVQEDWAKTFKSLAVFGFVLLILYLVGVGMAPD